ncbi:MAG: hypothetical protein HZA46_13760 [Planctomycetales bacterium]|nr:hypothetical protein [Planctomycetales bacterium]
MLTFDQLPFDVVAGLLHWLGVCGALLVVILITTTAISLATMGLTGPLFVLQQLVAGATDFAKTSPRRVGALTVLAIREAFRKKTLYVFYVFLALFLFAGWFLPNSNEDPELRIREHVSFVLRTLSWVMLPVSLLLSCWSLPDDIKARSLHTVVTKPVRRNEIVFGRILGIGAVASLILFLVGGIGYIWIIRQLPPAAREMLTARVPIWVAPDPPDAKDEWSQRRFRFIGRDGKPEATGINTGDEYMFRSYIEGNSQARAIYRFERLTSRIPADTQEIELESAFQVFRIHKGNIERGIMCQFTLVNEAKKLRASLKPFEVREFRGNRIKIPRQLKDEDDKDVDLLRDLIADGTLEVHAQCITPGQYLGMARPDLFLRTPDRPFFVSYTKGVAGIWMMMVMLTVMGVMASCFAKGPVATLFTAAMWGFGRMAHNFMGELTGKIELAPGTTWQGGGPFESIWRIIAHITPSVPLEDSFGTRVVQFIDGGIIKLIAAVQYIIPDFRIFNLAEYVANGFDVPFDVALLRGLATTLGYAVPWIVVGYFSLKLRELEAK